jgi:hypothetical protein
MNGTYSPIKQPRNLLIRGWHCASVDWSEEFRLYVHRIAYVLLTYFNYSPYFHLEWDVSQSTTKHLLYTRYHYVLESASKCLNLLSFLVSYC